MMLDSRDDFQAEVRWKHHGGSEPLASYGDIGNIPQTNWRFLFSCRPFYETEDSVFTHANYCWYSPLDQQPASLLRWLSIEESTPQAHLNKKTFILGHTPGSIRDGGFYRCIDTGCGFGGRLTAMDVIKMKSWQIDETGEWMIPDEIVTLT